MSTATYRQLNLKDSARISCQATINKQLDSCGSSAVMCETLHWDTGNTKGVSFFYFCDTHNPQRFGKIIEEQSN